MNTQLQIADDIVDMQCQAYKEHWDSITKKVHLTKLRRKYGVLDWKEFWLHNKELEFKLIK